jgi:hypothetical protein
MGPKVGPARSARKKFIYIKMLCEYLADRAGFEPAERF